LCLCPQDTTSFDRLRSTSFRLRTQNDVTPYGVNDVMLRINDFSLWEIDAVATTQIQSVRKILLFVYMYDTISCKRGDNYETVIFDR